MNFNNISISISNKKYSNIYVATIFILYFFAGLSIVKDFGLSIDEPFHRTNGYYWYLNIVKKFSSDYELINLLKNKLENMHWAKEMANGQYLQYGVFFDVLSTAIEEFLRIDKTRDAFIVKHSLTFIIFFISSIFFYNIILERFKNKQFSILITFFYVTSPRIFAESFYNCKDIVFMSFCVYSLYFCLKSLDKIKVINIVFFALFAALATDIRIMGILLFCMYLIFLIINSLEEKYYLRKNYKFFLILFFLYPLFVFLFWPYLWDDPVQNFIFAFKSFSNYGWGAHVLYLGEFVKSNNLPWHYIPVWVIVSSPVIFLIFFFIGFLKTFTLLFNNFINTSETNNLWSDINEKKDFFVIFFFLMPIILVVLLNSTLYGGWRHVYFIYPCFVYLIGIGLNFISNLKFRIFYKKVLSAFIFCALAFNIYNLIKFHPYQNIYFNILVEKKANKLFEIDYWGLGNLRALNYIEKNKREDNLVTVRTASFTPLNYSSLMMGNKNKKLFLINGTVDLNQDFIFTNYIYENDPRYEKKYFISNNYDKFYTLKKGNVIINEIYKKK